LRKVVNLPLHDGRCPRWLFERMVRLSVALLEIMVREMGPNAVLERLADPYWFQAFGCALGFDWHSSGLTTTVCGAVKEALRDRGADLGLFVCGGKGATARQTPGEIASWVEKQGLGLDAAALTEASRLAAKVDGAALQDGYQLYHHTFIFTAGGRWAVIQQGMNTATGWARRYHWLSTTCRDFVCEPHHAVCCDHRGRVLNLVAAESGPARKLITELAREAPEKTWRDCRRLEESALNLPARHGILPGDLTPRGLQQVLLRTYERQPEDFTALVGVEGLGPKALRALSLLAELAYGTPASFRDPVKYSFAHGGKDGHPYPVDRAAYDLSIDLLRRAAEAARLGHSEKLGVLRRLARWPS